MDKTKKLEENVEELEKINYIYSPDGEVDSCHCPNCNRYLNYDIPNISKGFRYCKYCGCMIYCIKQEGRVNK